MIWLCALLILACLIGSLPLVIKNNHKTLHFLLAISAGIFISIVSLHLIPELPDGFQGHWFLLGFASILFAEKVIRKEDKNHTTSSITAFIGLSLHAFVAGLAIGTSPATLLAAVSLPMMIHKITEAMSLSSLLSLSLLSKRLSIILLGLFSLITPIGVLLSPYFSILVGHSIALELAAGTFMYVTTDIIDEVFCKENKGYQVFIFFSLGILLMIIL